MARRDGAGVRLVTRNGHDFTHHFPLAAAAVTALPARSFLIDGEAIVTDDDGGVLTKQGITISMDGKGTWRDNVFVERLWRTI